MSNRMELGRDLAMAKETIAILTGERDALASEIENAKEAYGMAMDAMAEIETERDRYKTALATAFGLTTCFIELQKAIKAKDVAAANAFMALIKDADQTLERALEGTR